MLRLCLVKKSMGRSASSVPVSGSLGLGNHYQGGGGILESSTLSYRDAIPEDCLASRMIVLDPIR